MPIYPYAEGWLELIVGPMFSGKSEELIRRVTRALIAKQAVQVFKPAIDDRYDASRVASHAGRTLETLAIKDVADLKARLEPFAQVVAIDEGQFLPGDLVALAVDLAESGKRVIIAGLDLDFRGEPFGPIPELLARAEAVTKLAAICACGHTATRTQRLVNGRPAHYHDPSSWSAPPKPTSRAAAPATPCLEKPARRRSSSPGYRSAPEPLVRLHLPRDAVC